jgi:hypothetical protein
VLDAATAHGLQLPRGLAQPRTPRCLGRQCACTHRWGMGPTSVQCRDDERAARDHQDRSTGRHARPKRGWRVLGQDARARERRTVDAHDPRIRGVLARRAPSPHSPPSAVRLRGRWARAPHDAGPSPCLPAVHSPSAHRGRALRTRRTSPLSSFGARCCTGREEPQGAQLLLTAPALLTLSMGTLGRSPASQHE